jgi:site-specific recombinase XerD
MSDLIASLPTQPGAGAVLQQDIALSATTDIEAVSAWLVARGGRTRNTFDAYRREAARLLLWLREHGLGLRDMKVEHVHDFYKLLANPPKHWLRPRKTKRGEVLLETQVLVKKLEASSIAYSRTVLGQMYTYLQEAGYVQRNVFRLSIKPAVVQTSVSARFLDLESWQWLWGWIVRMPRSTAREVAHAVRARWIMSLLYHTGMRREEVAVGKMGDFVRKDGEWELRVIGKGSVERFVTVNSALLQEVVIYRTALELEYKYPVPGEALPLVVSLNRGREAACMTPRAIGLIVAGIADSAAKVCPDQHVKARIEAMSTHWMRHTNATHRLMAGASNESTQDELGHKDPKTTAIYAKVVSERKREDAEKLARLGSEDGE